MCGRTACALAPDDIVGRCTYQRRSSGQREKPVWRDPQEQKYYPSHNIAPASHTPVLLSSRHYGSELEGVAEPVIQPMKWGLTPSWHKGDPYKVEYETNNCRAEGMLTKRMYKVPLEKGRRCVILAEGFFEWKRSEKVKQPYYIYFPKSDGEGEVKEEKPDIKSEIKMESISVKTEVKLEPAESQLLEKIKQEDGVTQVKSEVNSEVKAEVKSEVKVERDVKADPEEGNLKSVANSESNNNGDLRGDKLLTMAGVFDVWKPPDGGEPLYSYSVITVDASPAMAWIHHRMPAILQTDEDIEAWLDSDNVPLHKAIEMIHPIEGVTMHAVSPVVNNSRNKTPDCVKPYDPKKPKTTAASSFMMNWLGKSKRSDSDTEKTSPAKKQKSET
ncbi:LOW QUALITY PROTEIN: abasic site processing protein HMCES-like [Haliotis rubra]|uniref:LOW QUALITY PROTEIN: abasic site processing protein HMCES-like n=1 Tax=Haliotis rubra TaxID=36100 RepID=UPI001EE4F23F|nr:LOW QUALITY PROTEIN: abasic site processing protein HMCES-like [Haliotis rubra]